MFRKFFLLLLLQLSCIYDTFAQPYCDVRTFSLRDGLAANIISGIGQTGDGLMWLGTWSGLCYYDGYRFTTFRSMPGLGDVLTSNRIYTLHTNYRNDVWVTTYDRRLYLFDTERCAYVNINRLIASSIRQPVRFHRIISLSDGHTWATTEGSPRLTLRIDDDRVEAEDGIAVYRGLDIRQALVDGYGHEWLLSGKAILDCNARKACAFPAVLTERIGSRTYFISAHGGVVSVGSDGKTFQKHCADTKDLHVNDVCAWRGKLLLGTSQGLLVLDHQRLRELPLRHPALSSADITKIFVDRRGRIWLFSSNDGVAMLDGDRCEWLQAEPQQPYLRTTSSAPFFHEDEYGTIWVVPRGGTFSYYDERLHSLVAYPLHSGETTEACIPLIKKSFVDNQHNLWFSGERNLSMLHFRRHRVRRLPMVVNQEVRALCLDRDGNLWAGDREGYLTVYDREGRQKGYLTPSGALQSIPARFAHSVYSIKQDSMGRMWIGTKGEGLYCWDGKVMSHYAHDRHDRWSLSNDDIYDIFEDSSHRLWIATYGGGVNCVEQRSDGSVRFVNVNNLFRNYPRLAFLMVRRIAETRHGEMVVATNGGLITFSGKSMPLQRLRFFTTSPRSGDDHSLSSSTVLQALPTHDGHVFVNIMGGGVQEVTDDELLHNDLRLKTITSVTADEGLVQAMVEDRQGSIWLVRETTIDKYDRKHRILSTFSAQDIGYPVEFSEAKPLCRPGDGNLFMACNGCIVAFAPGDLHNSSVVPRIAFTSVRYQGDDQPQAILNSPVLEVPSDKRSLTIYFSALDYAGASRVRYAYQLEGDGDKWNYVDDMHSASFNRIPHGHLRLLVRSTNANGVWQNNTRALVIYAHPTFWESWMGWCFYVIVGGALVFLAIYLINQRQRMKMQTEMGRMRAEFFTRISHQLRTPLTLIGGPVTEVLKSEKLSERGHGLLNMVRRNSQSMLALVDNMLHYDRDSDNYLVDDTNAPFALSNVEQSAVTDTVEADHGQRTTLLVVEDNADLRLFLSTILSHDYTVLTADNGLQGLETARKQLPDFIISDVMMPVMDGLAMVHELKQDATTSHIPIIILSAKASMQDRLQGLREGIDDYIPKPFSATYLRERVANIIARRHSLQKEALAQLTDRAAEAQEQTSQEKSEENAPTTYRLSAPEIIDADKVMMDKLMAFLEEHISDPALRMEDMADEVNLSRTAFYSKMRSIVGMPPVEFVRHIRLQRAELLVAKSKDSFSQIAYAVGFADPKYFSKCFRKATGMTPSEYRRLKRQENAGDSSAM